MAKAPNPARAKGDVDLVAVEPVKAGGRRIEPGGEFVADAAAAQRLLDSGAAVKAGKSVPPPPPPPAGGEGGGPGTGEGGLL